MGTVSRDADMSQIQLKNHDDTTKAKFAFESGDAGIACPRDRIERGSEADRLQTGSIILRPMLVENPVQTYT